MGVREELDEWLEETFDDHSPAPGANWTFEHWRLLMDEHEDHWYWATYQRSAPEEITRWLAAVDDVRIRGRVAEKRNLPRDLFEVMAADVDPHVRRGIACNQKSPLELVERLTHDPVEIVSRVAKYNFRERSAKLAKKQQQ